MLKKLIDWWYGPKTSPCQGGCWFCYRPKGRMYISREFDCGVHLSCLKLELLTNPENPEALIMATELLPTWVNT